MFEEIAYDSRDDTQKVHNKTDSWKHYILSYIVAITYF